MNINAIAIAAITLAASTFCHEVILHGKGFGTYYYDILPSQTSNVDFSMQNQGGVMCSWNSVLSLNEINSNNLVAMSNFPLKTHEGRAEYCGKRVVVRVNGVTSDIPFFIGDGCERCAQGSDSRWDPTAAAGLDFSYTALCTLSPLACQTGHVDITFDITNETLYHFDV